MGKEKKARVTQCDRILQFMHDNGSISDVEAYCQLGIRRLASRIHDLRSLGYPVVGVFETSKNQYGKIHYKRYSLMAETNERD